MSLCATLKAAPMLARIGVMQAVAYRAELLVWILSTTLPLVMLALFSAVAEDGPLGRFSSADFTAYFLATFLVRQFTASWASWEINDEVRSGTLSMRLLRPVSPIVSYAIENLSAFPSRLIIAVPVALLMLAASGSEHLPADAVGWLLFFLSWLGAWLLTFIVHVIMGTLAFWLEQSIKLMDVWFAGYLVFSGYLVPIELFPPGLREVALYSPFHAQIGLPVETLIGAHTRAETLGWIAVQWGWVLVLGTLCAVLWRRGLRRYGAVGG